MTRRLLRHILILAFALFGGPAPVATAGEWVVICGADGAAKLVLYDFDRGAPAEPDADHHQCERCGFCGAVALLPDDHAAPARPTGNWAAAAHGASLHPSPAPGQVARAPPLI